MFSLGCTCGRAESRTPIPQRQEDCFSYVVSVDGVHVCHPQDIIEYESAGEDDPEREPQDLVEHGSIREDETESDSRSLVVYKSTGAAGTESELPRPLLRRRGKLLSAVRLAPSIWTQSTLVNPAGDRVDESNIADHPGSKSSEYELIKQIGIDGEGVIHLMRSRDVGQLIVRKTVNYARSALAKPIEAAMLQDVFPERHNNIIRLLAFESYQGFDTRDIGARYYLEYCSGGDLHQLVDQYRNHDSMLPEPFIWQAYQQLASALEFLHRGFDSRCSERDRRGICHRDIKPSNVFLRRTPDSAYPDVVLADFGHATLSFATYDPAGTVFWQPPELPRHSPRGDVYSLGAVMYFLIHFDAPMARLPQGVDNTPSVKKQWESAPEARQPLIEFVEGYSEELVCVMLIALEADEIKRKNSTQLLKMVNYCMEGKFPPDSDLLQRAMEGWPLAGWAFDHMIPEDGGFGEEEEEGEDSGAEQYMEMMERFGFGMPRQSSQSSKSSRYSVPASSDRRRRVGRRNSGERKVAPAASLGETW